MVIEYWPCCGGECNSWSPFELTVESRQRNLNCPDPKATGEGLRCREP